MDGEECRIEIQEEYSRTIDAHKVARMVADCFNSSILEWKYVTPEEQEEFSYAYANTYSIQCDDRLEPLGWPGANDGIENCEVPDPHEIDLQ
ncbi:MAG: hypothetical protein U5L75_03445 [Candidatus Campbellbacteria bacterium]|nr:hypothetical protein [Candidatus Campbellbacteria bacterium]